MEHSYILPKYSSVDRIQSENILRTQFRIIKKYLTRKKWSKLSSGAKLSRNVADRTLSINLPDFISINTKVSMQLVIIYNIQKHNTEYHMEGEIDYIVTQNAYSNVPSSQSFRKKIMAIEKPIHDSNSKKEIISKFLSVAKQKINHIQHNYEDEDEYADELSL